MSAAEVDDRSESSNDFSPILIAGVVKGGGGSEGGRRGRFEIVTIDRV